MDTHLADLAEILHVVLLSSRRMQQQRQQHLLPILRSKRKWGEVDHGLLLEVNTFFKKRGYKLPEITKKLKKSGAGFN